MIGALRTIKHTVMAHAYRCAAELLSRVGSRTSADPERRLLIVCTAFPPLVGGGTYRPLSWVRLAREFGWRVTIATQSSAIPRSRAGEELLKRVPADATVIRLPNIWIKPSPRFFPSTDGALSAAYYQALVTMRRMEQARPSLVLASGPEFDNFTLARLVAQHFRAPLVLDYRDEWSDSPFDFVQHGKHDRIYERRALDAARLAIFTTRSQLEMSRRSFRDTPERIVIPNGWDDDLFSPSGPNGDAETSEDLITIRYTGNLGLHVDPTSFLSALAEANRMRPDLIGRIRLRITGSVHASVLQTLHALKLDPLVSIEPAVPQSEVAQLLRRSDALLILYPKIMARYVPGKFYEYMVSGRPILVVGEAGEVPDIVRHLDAGFVISGTSAQALVETVERLSAASGGHFNKPDRQRWVKTHSRSEAARILMRKLAEIADNRAEQGAIQNG